jgi:hypothetical protein
MIFSNCPMSYRSESTNLAQKPKKGEENMKASLIFCLSLIAAFAFAGPAMATNTGGPSVSGNADVSAEATRGAAAVTFDLSPGTGAPPATLGGFSMDPIPYPGAPGCTGVQPPLPTPGGSSVGVSPTSGSRCIGSGWATWSHGYTGDVYYTGGSTSQSITLPSGTKAVYFYVEPNPFSLQTFNVTADGVSSGSFTAHGSSGATYVGVYNSSGSISSISITCDTDFASGEFAIAAGPADPWVMDVEGAFSGGQLALDFELGTGGTCKWVVLMVIFYPSQQTIPLWAIDLPAIAPPISIPISFSFYEMPVVIWSGLISAGGIEASDVVLIKPAGPITFDLSPGTGAPPATLGGYSMTPIPPGAPSCTGTAPPLATPGGGSVGISPADTRCIGSGWATWSHGYTGDVYFTGGSTSQSISLPSGTKALYFYVEPNPFSEQTFEVVCDGVSSGSFSAHGSAGATYVGVYSGTGISSCDITCSTDFASGEYGWSD